VTWLLARLDRHTWQKEVDFGRQQTSRDEQGGRLTRGEERVKADKVMKVYRERVGPWTATDMFARLLRWLGSTLLLQRRRWTKEEV
jgi:hypothetical protein